mmetsp:Transcript_45628/g.53413  ORF Transcript_45628/g.53413 Transcript_45628/m.53413 type:complete len:245 (-) Transcript_45628:1779-2513(-)
MKDPDSHTRRRSKTEYTGSFNAHHFGEDIIHKSYNSPKAKGFTTPQIIATFARIRTLMGGGVLKLFSQIFKLMQNDENVFTNILFIMKRNSSHKTPIPIANAAGSWTRSSDNRRTKKMNLPTMRGELIAVHNKQSKLVQVRHNSAISFSSSTTLFDAQRKWVRSATLASTSDSLSVPQAQRPCTSAPPTPRSSHPSGGLAIGIPLTSFQNSIMHEPSDFSGSTRRRSRNEPIEDGILVGGVIGR